MKKEKYIYKNAPIPGGGYVTAFLFDEKNPESLYLRTDIGGAYRFDRKEERWVSLIDHVTMEDLRETYPIALAVGESGTGTGRSLYIVSGTWRGQNAKLSVTDDDGKTFRHYELPFTAHGNLNGRGTGRHLIVDRRDSSVLYYSSQTQGLWKSADFGKSWSKCEGLKEDYLTFIAQTPDGGAIIVGSAGVTAAAGEDTKSANTDVKANPQMSAFEQTLGSARMRGPALYISFDGGVSFEALPVPENVLIEEVVFSGLVAQRYAFDDKYLYVTLQIMGPNARNRELGYSCDGGSVWGGRVLRYELAEIEKAARKAGEGESLDSAEAIKYKDITPVLSQIRGYRKGKGDNPMDSGGTFGRKDRIIAERGLDILSFGLGGIALCPKMPGLIALSTLSKEDGDCIFRSFDRGESWECILYDLETGVMDFRTEYMKPQYNGGHNLIHWMSDLVINPADPEELWFNTGTGPFRTKNLLSREVHFSDYADGIEETVHINAYGTFKGEVNLIDIVGDLGGFAFKDLDKPCDNSFADEQGNRYITCLNADYSDRDPFKVIVTARGNWTGKTRGGLIYSKDQCKSFERLKLPFGLSDKLDGLFTRIEKPNVNSGWVALSPSGEKIVWSVADAIYLPADCVVVSCDGGNSFEKVKIFDFDGKCISDPVIKIPENARGFKAFSDRVRDDVFYGFGQFGELFVSRDGGRSFYRTKIGIAGDKPFYRTSAGVQDKEDAYGDTICGVNFSLVDTADRTEIRPVNGESGVFYMALREFGLCKLTVCVPEDDEATAKLERLSAEGDIVYRLGLGVGREGGDYLTESKALYFAAKIAGEYGFYRSCDECRTLTRLNTDSQMFGEINSIAGDGRVFGRFFLATGSRGIIYGERDTRPE